jgi:hypothetical protein
VQQPKQPAWDPGAHPTRLSCGWRVYGWAYPDGTIELVCREKTCKRPGLETRHLFNPATGQRVDVWVAKPNAEHGVAVVQADTPIAASDARQKG